MGVFGLSVEVDVHTGQDASTLPEVWESKMEYGSRVGGHTAGQGGA